MVVAAEGWREGGENVCVCVCVCERERERERESGEGQLQCIIVVWYNHTESRLKDQTVGRGADTSEVIN